MTERGIAEELGGIVGEGKSSGRLGRRPTVQLALASYSVCIVFPKMALIVSAVIKDGGPVVVPYSHTY